MKFHAAQSIVVFGGLTTLRFGLLFMHGFFGGFVGFGLFGLLSLIGFRLPIAADIADTFVK